MKVSVFTVRWCISSLFLLCVVTKKTMKLKSTIFLEEFTSSVKDIPFDDDKLEPHVETYLEIQKNRVKKDEVASPPFFCRPFHLWRRPLTLVSSTKRLSCQPVKRPDWLSYHCPVVNVSFAINVSDHYQYLISNQDKIQVYPFPESQAHLLHVDSLANMTRKYYTNISHFATSTRYRELWLESLHVDHANSSDHAAMNQAGLDTFFVSASRQPSHLEFDILFLRHRSFMLDYLAKAQSAFSTTAISFQLYYVDLRQESHGFVNGLPVYFRCPYNWSLRNKTTGGHSAQFPQEDEMARLADLCACPTISLATRKDDSCSGNGDPILVRPTVLQLESSIVGGYASLCNATTDGSADRIKGIEYIRWRTADHSAPFPEHLDRMVRLCRSHFLVNHASCDGPKSLPFFHFHCNGGKGRVSVFTALLDILLHAGAPHRLSFDSIIKRQSVMHDYDLLEIPSQPNKIYKKAAIQERVACMYSFYDYIVQYDPLSHCSDDDYMTFTRYTSLNLNRAGVVLF